ncbi:hypothetical protein BH23PLA1_BH23PLA1_35460 [soil metagenome]
MAGRKVSLANDTDLMDHNDMNHLTHRFSAILAMSSLSFAMPALADDGGRTLFDFSKPDAVLLIRLRSVGREDLRNLDDPSLQVASSYRATIPTEPDEWVKVKIPIQESDATAFGRKHPDAGPVDAPRVNSSGFVLSDKKEGPYQREIAWVEFTAGSAATPADPTTKTFTYKTIPNGGLDLVVHDPPGWKESDKRPGIVFFFGGGWTNGTIQQFELQADNLARLGMVAARADYRVKSRQGVTPDECVEDAKSAVRWLRANASKLGIDPDRIVAAGGLAGGHIAACTALTEGLEADGEDHSVSSKPNVLVLFNPVLQFDGVPQLMDRIGNDEALGQQISPTLHVSKDTPPTLLLYGTADRLIEQGRYYMERSREVGFQAELFTAEGQGHGFFNRPPWQERTIARMNEFLSSLGYLESRPSHPAAEEGWVSLFDGKGLAMFPHDLVAVGDDSRMGIEPHPSPSWPAIASPRGAGRPLFLDNGRTGG